MTILMKRFKGTGTFTEELQWLLKNFSDLTDFHFGKFSSILTEVLQ